MLQPDANSEQNGPFEALHNQTPHHRRLRPPDLHVMTSEEQRVPLKPDTKLGRRESRIGLRGLFGRSKTGKEGDAPTSPGQLMKPGGIRASWVDLSSWTAYAGALPHQRSTPTLPTIPDCSAPPSPALTSAAAAAAARQKLSNGGATRSAPPPRMSRGTLATWDPPPLFQAYPQAIRHAHLPACTHSADTILRLNDKRNARDDMDAVNDISADKDKKKKHRRNLSSMLEWTTKIYVLVTSGYLLQYSGEGSFDRLPEKMLHLGKDSAAFASDVIPGRHWVLQIASVMEANGAAASDSRSLFSRLPFRASEKRHASNFLMVFESAEDMDAWITILRREIEALGGKKNLSETGKPKANDNVLELKAQPSQRTLVVRDPERFSRMIQPQELTWQRDRTVMMNGEDAEGSVTVVEADLTPEQSMDDISTTNSVVSHDGRQLDNLRDSTGANRLSFISSGQRTIITSAGSSPACSPTRDSFASYFEEVPLREPVPEVRPRPNAAAIADRRQSMQGMNPLVDPKVASFVRPHSTYGPGQFPDPTVTYCATTPNFSVPHSVSRRYSLAKPPAPAPTLETVTTVSPQVLDQQPFQLAHPLRVSSRRCPPAGLMLSRPLSIVADQPSPILELEPLQTPATTDQSDSPSQQEHTIIVSVSPPPHSPLASPIENGFVDAHEAEAAGLAHGDAVDLGVNLTPPRKASSMQTLRTTTGHNLDSPTPSLPIQADVEAAEAVRRCRSSFDYYPRPRSRSPSTVTSKQAKRASLQNLSPSVTDKRTARFSFSNASDHSNPPPTISALRAFSQLKHGVPLVPVTANAVNGAQMYPNGRLSVDKHAVPSRRSMPQLVEGPPPAPPPTCALPPIPQRRVKA